MSLAQAYPKVRQYLENWVGYPTLLEALIRFEDLQVFLAGGIIRNCLLESSSPPKDFDFFLQGPSIQPAVELFAQKGQLATTPYGAPRWYPLSAPQQYADLMSVHAFVPGLWPCEELSPQGRIRAPPRQDACGQSGRGAHEL